MMKQKNKIMHIKYKTYRNKIVNLVRISKFNHYETYFKNNSSNSKKTWYGINEIINKNNNREKSNITLKINDTKIIDPTNISNEFNMFKVTPPSHVGFVNKGNTYYANAILQALSTVPSLWSQWASESSTISPLARSVVSNISLLSKSASSIDLSNFLRALQCTYRLSAPSFNFNVQHDAAEILSTVLDDITGSSQAAS